ncbi:hypothetical protein SAY87_002802 [Trapa incisa]|uniref:Uncharacterized protein n=1 Tax=Trapa incisa TaxID=236973 RepID=A0AAN7PW48_9MYRT|nr:hypothetical protein SAY87_002802 [Trapa incisa]
MGRVIYHGSSIRESGLSQVTRGGERGNEARGGNGGGDGGGNADRKLTTIDALMYLREIKDTIPEQWKYDLFLDAMKDLKAQRLDIVGITARVRELFEGHTNLIRGFNKFLPRGYEIALVEEEASTMTVNRATVNRVLSVSSNYKINDEDEDEDEDGDGDEGEASTI